MIQRPWTKPVRIWKGDEDEEHGEYHLQSHLGNQPPDDSKYLIEVIQDDELIRERFAASRMEAVQITEEETQRLHRGA